MMAKLDSSHYQLDEYGFPRIDWDSINANIPEDVSEPVLHEFYEKYSLSWLKLMQDRLPDYTISSSENFQLLSNYDDRSKKLFLALLETCLSKIMKKLPDIACDEGYGKHVVFAFHKESDYYEYISYYYPVEGEFSTSGASYINDNYGHFVFPRSELAFEESIATHEMTHACLSHLNIPLWLDEGLAVTMQQLLYSKEPFLITKEDRDHHLAYWNNDNIQEFWSGEAFSIPEISEISYQLAQILTNRIIQDHKNSFANFVNEASWSDAGEGAAIKHLKISLGQLLFGFLGLANCKPDQENLSQS